MLVLVGRPSKRVSARVFTTGATQASLGAGVCLGSPATAAPGCSGLGPFVAAAVVTGTGPVTVSRGC